MTRGIIAAFALAGLLSFGCDKDERKAPTDAKENAADKAKHDAKEKADQVDSAAKGAVNEAQDRAKAAEKNAESAGKATVDAVKAQTDQVKAIKDNFDKAVSDKKFDEADKYITQLEALNKDPIPADKQAEIKSALVGMREQVQKGRAAMTPTP
jgi:hypothetical protein